MDKKDLIKLRMKIHEDFHKCFSYSRKFNCLYSDWCPTESEKLDFINYVGSDFKLTSAFDFIHSNFK